MTVSPVGTTHATTHATSAGPPEVDGGVPSLADLDALKATPFWREIKDYSDAFLKRHGEALRGYGRHWGEDPMHLWSRRWEYPFAARGVLAHAARTGRTDLACCDAGSGVTFLPYLLCDRLPGATFTCCDTNARYVPMFDAVARGEGHDRVRFTQASVQTLPFDDASLDVLCCVSVLEHTGDYATSVREMARVIRPGGRLVLTFDLSLDGKFELAPTSSSQVFDALAVAFEFDADAATAQAARAYADASGLLSTPEVKRREPQHLPWKYPRLQALYDLYRGHGWTGGFRAVAPFCVDAARRTP